MTAPRAMPAGAERSGPETGSDRAVQETLEELRRQNAELMEAVKARDEFLAIAAHELRNPMTPIIGQIALLLRAVHSPQGAPPERIREGLERLEISANQFVRRATTLLDISRFNAGRFRLHPEEVDLSLLVRSVAEGHVMLARHAGCLLDVRVQDRIVGICDRTAAEEIVDNLLSNAIKYGAGHPVELDLSRQGTEVILTVRDRGPGISKQDQVRIFAKFERLFGDREHAGFGVGLWLVRKLVDAMGGRITVSSRPGEGATFTVAVPLKQPEAAA